MAILVTGGAGYIGSVAVESLKRRGEEVVVLDDLVLGHSQSLDDDIPLYKGNAGDRALIARIARTHNLECCIHFAALACVGESVANPAKYFENNVEQGIALIGGLLQAGVRKIVFSSTCATYGVPEQVPIQEENRQWPMSPYGWSKLIVERLLDSYDSAYGLRFVALRYFNAAGATRKCGEHHEPESHLIPNIISVALGERPYVSVFGNTYPTPDGTPIRDYIHVSDLADAHLQAVDYLRGSGRSEFLNLGTGCGSSVMEVIECARQATGRQIPVRIEPPRPGDAPILVADPDRAQNVLGWKPTTLSDLRSIICSAWEWRLLHPQGYSADGLSMTFSIASSTDRPPRASSSTLS